MSELPSYRLAPILVLMHVRCYSNDQIIALLASALTLGLDLGAGSPLEDLTVAELEILVSEAGTPC